MTAHDDRDRLQRELHELRTKLDNALGLSRFLHWLDAWIRRRGWFQ